MGELFVKVAVNLDTHPKIRRAGRNGREVFQFVLRRVGQLDTNGTVPASCVEPWYLADVLMMPEADAAEGVSRAVTARLLAVEGDTVRVVGWDEEWAKRPRTDAERKADQRAREKAATPPVTDSHADVTETVTQRDSHGCHASEEIRGEERRGEKTQNTEPAPEAPSAAARPRSRGGKAKPPVLSPEEAEAVAGVLDKLSRESGTEFRATSATHQRVIVARLREGATEDEMRAVIVHCAAPKPAGLGWRDNPEMRPFLRPETLFGPTTIERYLPAARKLLAEMEPS